MEFITYLSYKGVVLGTVVSEDETSVIFRDKDGQQTFDKKTERVMTLSRPVDSTVSIQPRRQKALGPAFKVNSKL